MTGIAPGLDTDTNNPLLLIPDDQTQQWPFNVVVPTSNPASLQDVIDKFRALTDNNGTFEVMALKLLTALAKHQGPIDYDNDDIKNWNQLLNQQWSTSTQRSVRLDAQRQISHENWGPYSRSLTEMFQMLVRLDANLV
jgi:hypothetical protein